MTLSGLLSLLRGLILNDRTDRESGTSDYLWTDTTLVTYINEAQRRFAVQGLVLRDGTNDDVTKVELVEGQTIYPLHESVLAVLSAKPETGDADLQRVGHCFLNAYRQPTESWVEPATYNALQPGSPLAFSTDEALSVDDFDSVSRVQLRVYPEPSASEDGDFLRLRVIRKPIERLVAGNLAATPEIPEDHHIEMLDYAAYLALRIADDDGGDWKRAEKFRQDFEAHVKAARTTVMRKLFAPLGWGFGRNGFSWER